jgi:Alw26I/Eco31I/Esp3I family type II restriction m6 adenine DNA methyltransferase
MTPRDAANLRILDPACGSGSFLLGAYKYLLDWHLDWYLNDGPEKHKKELFRTSRGEWRLTTKVRKEILVNNIFGVDIDPQAVEVTKLSLLLQVLDGESIETLANLHRFWHERALPDLSSNIKCGNSLIGPDFYDDPKQGDLFDNDEDREHINVFDWEAAFPKIMRDGGFDAVIRNPPYDVLEKDRGAASWPHEALADYVRTRRDLEPALGGKTNLFRFFLVRSIQLTRMGGRFGMILPLALLADTSCAASRLHLLLNSGALEADCFPQKDNVSRRIFRNAKLSTGVITCARTHKHGDDSAELTVRAYPWNSFDDQFRLCSIRLTDLRRIDPKNVPIPLLDEPAWELCRRIHRDKQVARMGDCHWTSITRGEINQTIYREFIREDPRLSRLLKGVEVGQYRQRKRLKQGKREWFDEKAFLKKNTAKPIIHQRRIATQRITGVDEKLRIVATIVEPPCYFADSTNSITVESGSEHGLEYVLGLLNSQLFQWRFKATSTNNNVGTNELDCMPIRVIDFSSTADKSRHDTMVQLVERMLALHERLAKAKTPREKDALQTHIDATDRQIDSLVYELYGLTEEEIRIVEGGDRKLG